MKMNKFQENILRQISELNISEIVQKALEGWIPNKNDGIAAYNWETGEIETVSLSPGCWIPKDKRIYLYTIPANLLSVAHYTTEDWLFPDEIEDFKKRNKAEEHLTPVEYIEKYTDETVEGRLLDIIEFYADEFEPDDEKILTQILTLK